MINYANYFLTLIGLGMIIVSLFLIFSDKLKGEGLYFDLYVKEQEIKKAISDADEIIDELKYTSETLIDEIEQNINILRNYLNEVKEKEVNLAKSNNVVLKNSINEAVKEEDTSSKINRIYEYYSQGMNSEEIAKSLGIGKGEVSLILSLYNGDAKNGDI